MIAFELATPDDVPALTDVQIRCFDDDARQHDLGERGGPPGYDSEAWQSVMMQHAAYYKIVDDGRIIGGMIAFDLGGGHFELGRIYLDPVYQNRGIGTQALRFVEAAHPQATRWTLDTPSWARRNRHFYEKMGYVKTGELQPEGADFTLFLYEKRIAAPEIAPSGKART